MKIKMQKLGKGNFNEIKIPQRFLHNPPKPDQFVKIMQVRGVDNG